LKKLTELNKARLKSIGAFTENGTSSSDDDADLKLDNKEEGEIF
jgi:hypothetical protein